MSIFKNRRLDLKIQYIIIVHSLDLVKWNSMEGIFIFLFLFLFSISIFYIKIVIKSSHKATRASAERRLICKRHSQYRVHLLIQEVHQDGSYTALSYILLTMLSFGYRRRCEESSSRSLV